MDTLQIPTTKPESLVNDDSKVLTGKSLSMPLKDQLSNLMKKHKRAASWATASTSCNSVKYADEAEILDWSVEQLTDKHVKMYEKCNKYDKEDAQLHFDHIASNYEGMYNRMGYPDPEYVANYVARYTKNNDWNPENIKIMDFGCGTGLVGQYLHEQGFKNTVGLDISPKMLEVCSEKGMYKELHEHALGDPSDFPEKFKLQFDFVTCAGLINNNHMDYLLFEEMLLSVKKGGYIVFAARYSQMGKYWYDDVIKEMQDSCRWTLKTTESFYKYDKLQEVSIGRFSRTPVKVFVFQKTQDDIRQHVSKINDKLKNFLKMKLMTDKSNQ